MAKAIVDVVVPKRSPEKARMKTEWMNEAISTVHNYISFMDFIIRKGAISSYEYEHSIIPFNMEDGSLITVGKSNPEWNFSAPHGAGRILSRTKAKEVLNYVDTAESMHSKGVYSTSIPLDESKGAYKDPGIIEESIQPTAVIVDRIVPFHNMKEGGEPEE